MLKYYQRSLLTDHAHIITMYHNHHQPLLFLFGLGMIYSLPLCDTLGARRLPRAGAMKPSERRRQVLAA